MVAEALITVAVWCCRGWTAPVLSDASIGAASVDTHEVRHHVLTPLVWEYLVQLALARSEGVLATCWVLSLALLRTQWPNLTDQLSNVEPTLITAECHLESSCPVPLISAMVASYICRLGAGLHVNSGVRRLKS